MGRIVFASLQECASGSGADFDRCDVATNDKKKKKPWDELSIDGPEPKEVSALQSLVQHNRLHVPAPAEGSHHVYRIAHSLLTSATFDIAVALVIILNAAIVGVDQTFRLAGGETVVFDYVESAFLVIYSVELVLRFIVQGAGCLKDNWVRFDICVIFLGWVGLIILATTNLEGFEVVVELRSIRMLRLCRTIGLVVKFRVLWMMAGGLLDSAGMMIHTLVLLFTIIYVFASIGIELTVHHPLASGESADSEFTEIVQTYFRNLPVTMLTLLQFVCLDSVAAIYKPLIEKDMSNGTGFLVLYFVMVILIMPIILMNIVTAVIVNRALEQASQDRNAREVFEEQEKKRIVKKLKQIFVRLDQDSSGAVSFEEIKQIEESDWVELQQLTSITNAEEVFRALDVDGNDRLDIDEFCQGIWQACISRVPVEIQRMEKQVSRMHQELRRTSAIQATISDAVGQICQELRLVREELHLHEAKEGACKDSDKDPELAGEDSQEKEMPAWGRLILAELQCLRREGCSDRWASDHGGRWQPFHTSERSLEETPQADPACSGAEELLLGDAANPQNFGNCDGQASTRCNWSARETPHSGWSERVLVEPVLWHVANGPGRGQELATSDAELQRAASLPHPHCSSRHRSGQEPECPPSFRPHLMMVRPVQAPP